MQPRHSTLAALALSLAACGGRDGDNQEESGSPDAALEEVDTEAPRVLSTTPSNNETGQRDDVEIVIEFSEPMDQGSVEDNLDIAALGATSLAWNEAGDLLTITPSLPLTYEEGIGNDPTVISAREYDLFVMGAAKDLAGNELGESVGIHFTTLRRMKTNAGIDGELTRSLDPSGNLQGDINADLFVGDLNNDIGIRSLYTFDLALLPADAVEVTKAILATRQLTGSLQGLPYGNGVNDTGLGNAVQIDHVSYTALDNAGFNASQTAHAALGNFCQAAQVTVEFDVTAAVDDDLASRSERGNRSQFLLRFGLDNDQDGSQDSVLVSKSLSELQLTYLVP